MLPGGREAAVRSVLERQVSLEEGDRDNWLVHTLHLPRLKHTYLKKFFFSHIIYMYLQ
jgi:hypothetical protein